MVKNINVDYAAVGRRVKDFRIMRDMTQEQLAENADLSVAYLSNIENAHSKASLPTFVKIANALGSGIDALLCDNLIECRPIFEEQLAALLADCSDMEIRLIVSMAKSIKDEIRNIEALKKRTVILQEQEIPVEKTNNA